MNVDAITNMVTIVLNDFATFWSNIWEFLRPLFNLGALGNNGEFQEGNAAHNWGQVIDAFNPDNKVEATQQAAEETGENA